METFLGVIIGVVLGLLFLDKMYVIVSFYLEQYEKKRDFVMDVFIPFHAVSRRIMEIYKELN